ncbi:hypothetical protein [Cribrihabitans pelagius]|uniref:hypothetical protein n=1 Tax=Cribrihabitans pelagius TaxID=1765746 RepID=UPI003B59B116
MARLPQKSNAFAATVADLPAVWAGRAGHSGQLGRVLRARRTPGWKSPPPGPDCRVAEAAMQLPARREVRKISRNTLWQLIKNTPLSDSKKFVNGVSSNVKD